MAFRQKNWKNVNGTPLPPSWQMTLKIFSKNIHFFGNPSLRLFLDNILVQIREADNSNLIHSTSDHPSPPVTDHNDWMSMTIVTFILTRPSLATVTKEELSLKLLSWGRGNNTIYFSDGLQLKTVHPQHLRSGVGKSDRGNPDLVFLSFQQSVPVR